MEILKTNGFVRIYEVDVFEKEFRKITEESYSTSIPITRYQRWLFGKLALLDNMGSRVLQLEAFEKLNVDSLSLFSIRYPHSKKNLRVIYTLYEKDKYLLLSVFKEDSANDYLKAIRKARHRLQQITS